MIEQTFHFLQKGGFTIYPILLCSVITIALAIERFCLFWKVQKNANFVIAFLKDRTLNNKPFELFNKEQGLFSTFILDALNTPLSKKELLEQKALHNAQFLQKNLDIFEFIITLAPLLGLLGTVTGMIQSFSVINIAAGKPLAISAGIGEALIATATGLLVAIIAAICHSFFKNWYNRFVLNFESIYTYFLEKQQ